MSDLPVLPSGIVLCAHCGARLSASERLGPGAVPLCPECAEEQADTRKLSTVAPPAWVSICEDLPREPRRRAWIWFAGAAALLVVVVVVARPRRSPPPIVQAPIPAPAPEPPPPVREPAPKAPEPKKEAAAPKPDPSLAELASLEREIVEFEAREEFGRGLEVLDRAKSRHEGDAWVRGVEERIGALQSRIEDRFAEVLKLAAKPNAPLEKAKLRNRVARWGLTDRAVELERAMAEAPPPPPPPRSKEAQAYLEEWERVMARAASRLYDRALPDLHKAQKVAQEDEVRREAAQDINDLTRVVLVLEEIGKQAAQWPRGSAIALETPAGKVSGAFVFSDGDRVEIRTAALRETAFVELSEATAGSLSNLVRGKADARALALLCLIEGDPTTAKRLLVSADQIPPKYWSWAAQARSRAAPPDEEALRRERSARELYYAAEREYRRPATRGSAVSRYRALMKDYLETALVRHAAPRIAKRTEGCGEYFFLARDFAGGGTFKASTRPAVGPCFVSGADSDFARGQENFVELEFYAMADEKYRCWFQVGGCCAETFQAFYQSSELTVPHPAKAGQKALATPGSLFAVAIAPPPITFKATHASHGGAKEPSLWGWVEVPLPKFASSGVKAVRLCTVTQGFAVARAIVSSSRGAAPKGEEIKELEASREPDLPAALPADSKR